jgi:HEAT repeat protein
MVKRMMVARVCWGSTAMSFVVIGCILLGGCGRAQGPTLAGGKPVAHWLQAVEDRNPQLRKEAVEKLGNVGPIDAAAIPTLVRALKDNDPLVRRAAILAILKVGELPREAIDSLIDLQQHDHDAKVREYAAKALKRLQRGAGDS